MTALIPLIGNVVASFLTVWIGGKSWLVVPVVGVVVAMVTALIQAYGSAGGPTPQAEPPRRGRRPPADTHEYARQRRGAPLPVMLLIVFLVIGVGGLGVTQVVRYAVGRITGNEPGIDRLVRPATGKADGLTLTVESVTYTDHFTRVGLAARNETEHAMTLPLFQNCVFIGRDGTTLEADSSRSHWSNDVAPGGLQRGTILFEDRLPDSVRRARLSFSTVFGFGFIDFGGPQGITVSGIRLRRGR